MEFGELQGGLDFTSKTGKTFVNIAVRGNIVNNLKHCKLLEEDPLNQMSA